MTGVTAEGKQAYQLLEWANQDQQARVPEAIEQVDDLARTLMGNGGDRRALAEVRDVGLVLARLDNGLTIGAQLAAAEADEDEAVYLANLDEYLDDALPGEVETWLGSISGQVELAAIHGHHIKGTPYTYRHGWLPLIGPQLNDKYPQWKMNRAKEASRQRHSTEEARSAAAVQKSIARHQQKVAQHTRPAVPAMPASAPTAPPPAAPGTIGERMSQEDPALSTLAAPGASVAALKAYIDARVATEVARQMGQIDARQETRVKDALAKMHSAQQKMIGVIRRQYSAGTEKEDADLRKHTVMNSLFTFAGTAVAVGGITFGLPPVTAMLATGIVPLVNVIHDYVRNLG